MEEEEEERSLPGWRKVRCKKMSVGAWPVTDFQFFTVCFSHLYSFAVLFVQCLGGATRGFVWKKKAQARRASKRESMRDPAAAAAFASFSKHDAYRAAFIEVLFEPCCMSAPARRGRATHTVPAAAAAPAVCRNFSRGGRCIYGLGCRYRHDQPSSRGGGRAASEEAAVSDLDPRTRRWLKCSGGGDAVPSPPSAGFEFTFAT